MSAPTTKDLMQLGLRSWRIETFEVEHPHRRKRRKQSDGPVASSSTCPPPPPAPSQVSFTHRYPVVLPVPKHKSRTRWNAQTRPDVRPTTSFSNKGDTMAGPIRATATRASQSVSRQPPRPLNAWILYRKAKLAELLQEDPELKRLPQSEISKRISRLWKEESEPIRNQYEYQANLQKTQHQELYPDYQFKPQKRSEKERQREERRVEKEKERAEQRRIRNMDQAAATRQRSATSTAEPPPTPGELPSELKGKSIAELQAEYVSRFGNYGPSPPVSEAPSPFGSPAVRCRSLKVTSESDRSQSRPPHAHSQSSVPSSYYMSPLELITALHNAHETPSGPLGAISHGDASTATSAIPTSWHSPQEQVQSSGHASSLAVAGPSGFAVPDASVTQGGNNFAGPQWPDSLARELNRAHVRPDAFGSTENGYSETYGQGNTIYDSINMDEATSQWPDVHNLSNQYYNNVDPAPLQGQLSSTDMPGIFSLTIPTTTFGDDPPGEIEISTDNLYATYQQELDETSGIDGAQQDSSNDGGSHMNNLSMFLQHCGVPFNGFDNNMNADRSNATSMNPAMNLSGTPPNMSIDTMASLHEQRATASMQNTPTPQTPDSDAQTPARPQSAVEHNMGMEPFVFPQDVPVQGVFALPTPPSAVSPTNYMNFPPMVSAAPSPSFVQSHGFLNASTSARKQEQNQSAWNYHIAYPQVQFQSHEQALVTPSPSPRVSSSHRVQHQRQQQQQQQQPRIGSLIAGGVRRVTASLFPSMPASMTPTPTVDSYGMLSPTGESAKENETAAKGSHAEKMAQVQAKRVSGQWRVARSS